MINMPNKLKFISLGIVFLMMAIGFGDIVLGYPCDDIVLNSNAKTTGIKIAVSATGPGLDSMVDYRFARCPYFIIVDSETMQFKALQNPYATDTRGTGFLAAQMIAGEGVQAVITGNIGQNAFYLLSNNGIKVFSGSGETVRGAIQKYNAGQLKMITTPTITPMLPQRGR